MIYYQRGSGKDDLGRADLEEGVVTALDRIGPRKKVLAVPPDYTRKHSFAGPVTGIVQKYYDEVLTDILPALGTHTPMTDRQIAGMYPDVPREKFRVHNWRTDVITLGTVPASYVSGVSGGIISFSWPAQVNRLLTGGGYDLILSIGQVVPHEVIGMANYNKNIFVGTGGSEGINKSHFLGAAYGMEKLMGRADNPVRRVLNEASKRFAANLPVVYILSVVGRDSSGVLKVRGLYIGDDEECFLKASELSLRVNFMMLDDPLEKVVVYLDPEEYKSTWLGNKSIYRTRMALADQGELIILAPGVKEFGEDREIDRLIREYGYRTTPEILRFVEENEELRSNLGAAAHLIHGSHENRFTVTYCPGYLGAREIEGVGYGYGRLDQMMKTYNPSRLRDGYNTMRGGEKIFYVSNPGLGLWSHRERFVSDQD